MKKLTIILLGFLLSGCATIGRPINNDQLMKIKQGETTEQEIIAIFGTPLSKTLTGEGKIIMNYTYTEARIKATNFIPIVGLVSGGPDIYQQMLSILIDENGIVEKYTSTNIDIK